MGAASTETVTQKPLTFEALRQVVSVSDPQIAPGGSLIVYVRSVGDYKADRNHSELMVGDVADGMQRALTHDRDGVTTALVSVGRSYCISRFARTRQTRTILEPVRIGLRSGYSRNVLPASSILLTVESRVI